jgi:hypothetical protein
MLGSELVLSLMPVDLVGLRLDLSLSFLELLAHCLELVVDTLARLLAHLTSAYVSIRRHTSSYVSIRQLVVDTLARLLAHVSGALASVFVLLY